MCVGVLDYKVYYKPEELDETVREMNTRQWKSLFQKNIKYIDLLPGKYP